MRFSVASVFAFPLALDSAVAIADASLISVALTLTLGVGSAPLAVAFAASLTTNIAFGVAFAHVVALAVSHIRVALAVSHILVSVASLTIASAP